MCFKKDDYFNEEILIRSFTRKRNGKKFAAEYLNQDYGEAKLHIVRILDSKAENFKLPKIHRLKVEAGDIIVHNILTKPEIEILTIIHNGKYSNYTNKFHDIKPSEYCVNVLSMKRIIDKKFLTNYYQDTEKLVKTIREYADKRNNKTEKSLNDLLD